MLSADSISYNFSIFDIPGNNDTRATGINSAGEVVGSSADAGIVRSFLRNAGGSFTFFTVPGVPSTLARDINDLEQIVGSFFDPQGPHAFLRDTDGSITMFDAPGAGPGGTNSLSINPRGEITGYYSDVKFRMRGFVRDSNGTFTAIDAGPGGTMPISINPSGEVTGSYQDASGVHGFVR